MKFLGLLAVVLISFTGANAQVKKPEPVPVKISFTASLQAVVVTTKGWNDTVGTARLFERKNPKSDWKALSDPFPVNVGLHGLAWGNESTRDGVTVKNKQEGDGSSPAGMFPLTSTFGIGTKPNAVEMPYTKLDEYTECVDDLHSQFYNRIVNRMQVGNFDWKSSEKMFMVRPEYELGVFVAYNSYPAVKGSGSCIFLHVWKDPMDATTGCTAMERRNLERIVAWLVPAKNPYLVQLTDDDYAKYQKTWMLPKLK